MDKQLSESSIDRYHGIALVKMKQGEGKTLRQAHSLKINHPLQ